MVLDPMPAEDLLVLLDLIEPALDDWRLKRRIVQYLGAIPGGDWFGAPDAAPLVGKSRGWCRDVLAMLDEDRVIIRYCTAHGGRKIWCEVQPDWERWRGVPWRVDRQTIRERLAYVRERRSIDGWDRFSAFSGASHPRCAQLARVVGGRKRVDALNGAASDEHRGWLGAENAVTGYSGSASRFEPWAYPRSGGEHRGSGPQETALIEAVGKALTSIWVSRDREVERRELEKERGSSGDQCVKAHLGPEVLEVVEAIEARTTEIYDRTQPLRDVVAYVQQWGHEAVLGMVSKLDPGDMQSPRFVAALGKALRAADRQRDEYELRRLKERIQLDRANYRASDPADLERINQLCTVLGESPHELPMVPLVPWPDEQPI